MFDDARLKALYEEAFAGDRWAKSWRDVYEVFLKRLRKITLGELGTQAIQELLWSAKVITPVGPGEGVPIGDATTNHEVVNAIVQLRSYVWPREPIERSKVIQAEFNRILDLVTRGLDRRPTAKLWRVFAALLPEDMLSIVSWPVCSAVMKEVLPKPRGLYGVEAHVLIRARFREVLGPEADLREHVRRSTFSWFLYEKITGASVEETNTGPKLETGTLSVWPYQRQNKGYTSPRRNVETYRDVVREADGGARPEEIVEALAADPDFAGMNRGSLRQIVGEVKKIGLIELRDGELHPTDDGDQFLQGDEPDPLVVRMIERVFPMARMLKMFEGQELTRAQVVAELQEIYPRWTSYYQPTQMIRWFEGLGLVDKTASGFVLSDYGRYWVKRLPDALPTAPSLPDVSDEDAVAQPAEPEAEAKPWPSLPAILSAFDEYQGKHGLVIDRGQLVALHNALHCVDHKRFVILSGLSGTGKTRVMQAYAELFCQAMELDPQRHVKLIPVSPDWRDPAGLLGYVNELREDPVYQPGPALPLLLRAHEHRAFPYFLLLDEMNLARVELYFAPFLSAMETGGEFALHSRERDSALNIPAAIPWPSNLFILGSVNMDETTHPFSDKVLDRAFTMEFWDVDLPTFFQRQPERDEEAEKLLVEVHDVLRPIRRHFGYRTAKEFLGFVKLASADGAGAGARNHLLDQGVFSKILPRLRGEDAPALRNALTNLGKLLVARDLQRSSRKVAEMSETLARSGVTRFWG